ncbi:MAG: hypothetical protein ACRENL_09455, partial [Candidatus Dormibacteria bacterium]
VYAGAIDANGQVLGWNALGGLPVAMGAPAAGIVNGHLVVVAGGNTSGGTPAAWLAPVLAPGQLGAFRPIAAPPTWIADPTSTVVGDTLFVGGGTAGVMYSLQVSPTGDVGPWITQPAISPAPSAISVMASLGSTVYLIGTPGANVLTADSNRVPTISVPLHATGLAAATYDIVVSLAGPNDPNNSPQVGLSSGASSLPFAESKAGTAAWVGANDQLPANESGTSITTGWGDSTANATVAYAGGAIVLTSLAAGTMECAHFLAVTPNTDYTLQASAEASATGRSCQLNIIWYDANENQLASLSSGLVDTTGVFTAAAVTAASPPNAAFAFLSLEVFGTAAAGEVHRWTSLFWGEPSTVPLSVYASGNMSRLVHVLSDVQHGAPQEWGALAYNFWGQPVQYLEVVQPLVNLLSPNASSFGGPVQGTTAAWTPTNCTLAVVTPPVPPPVGFYNTQIAQYAMSLTSVGAGTMSVSTGLSGIPCDAGVTYTASADFLAVTVARSTTVGLAFYDASGTQIGSTTTGAAVADATTAWQAAPPFVTVAAPAGAATMAVVLSIAATAGAGEVHDVDLVIARVGQSAQYVAPGLGPGGLHVLRTLTYDPTSGQLVSLT